MKSPQQIAEEKYPLPFTAEPVATQNCTCYTCQIARREGYIAGMKEREKEAGEFAEWMGDYDNPFMKKEDGRWIQANGNSTSWTTEQLYNLYKSQK